ncbi:MAG: hypothetical protein JST76_08200 [Bacteroidetes bacterium]|nr:hypothetical protein [Bacteroidota bacterium]
MEPKKNTRARAVSIALVCIATILLMELALRVLGFYKTYTEKMDGMYVSYYDKVLPTHYWKSHDGDSIIDTKPEYVYHSRANNYGFRDTDFDTLRSEHTGKILVLGDSFVQGLGAPADSTWPHLLQGYLQQDGSAFWRVYNCGASGSDPYFEHEILKDSLLSLHPDMVIMSINYSDINDYITRGGFERFRTDGTTHFAPSPWFEPLYRHCHLVRLFIHFVLRYDFSLLSPAQHSQKVSEALVKLADCVEQTKMLCDQHGIYFVVVIHPYIDPYDRYLQKQDRLPELIPLVTSRGVCAINLFDDFHKYITIKNYHTYSWTRDMHYTSAGYVLFARFLLAQLNTKCPGIVFFQTEKKS